MNKLKKKPISPSWLIFLICIGLVLFGLFAIYNASSFEASQVFKDKFYFVRSQAISAGVGLFFLLLAVFFPLRKLKALSLPLIIVNTFLLILVLIPGIGMKILGGRRWLNLGFVSFQPSEFLKLTLSFYLAAWLEERRPIWPFLFLILFLIGLIVLEPDFGSAAVIITSAFLVYFLSGARIFQLLFISGLCLLIGIILIFSSSYRRNRIETFLNPTTDPLGQSYHLRQILISLGSGGFFGVGLGKSLQKYQYLPEATTDSIFAVIGEETGFLGCTFLVIVFTGLIFLGFKIAKNTGDRFKRLLVCGLTINLGMQAFINFSAMVSLIPLTGIPLPFISFGGSSLIVAMASIGILINCARKT